MDRGRLHLFSLCSKKGEGGVEGKKGELKGDSGEGEAEEGKLGRDCKEVDV